MQRTFRKKYSSFNIAYTYNTYRFKYLIVQKLAYESCLGRNVLHCMHWLQNSINAIVDSKLPVKLRFYLKYSDGAFRDGRLL